ncbi:hypothetical protein BDF14DRAFT_1994791 [Spinellus fusiger]|nr:hypothetical protein BDF14DRAFT_1994791 [Spinellus fusiger]
MLANKFNHSLKRLNYPKNLPSLSSLKSKSIYLENLDLLNTVFDLKRLKIDSLENLQDPTRTRKLAFSNLLRSDWFTADVVLYKKVNQGADDYSYNCNQVIDVEPVGKTVEQ